jgi:hypothetical protein
MPTTMELLRENILQGTPVDLNKLATLQMLDHVILDEKFVTESNERQNDADKQIEGFAL